MDEKFEEMKIEIQKYRKIGRVPLFILGAGVSAYKVPLMYEIVQELEIHIRERINNCSNDENDLRMELERLAGDAFRLAHDSLYQSRAVASKFFGILQEKSEYTSLWDRFTINFLTGLNNRDPIWNLTPTDFHDYVAREIVRESLPAICISLNYDGLTAKAMRLQALQLESIKKKEMEKSFPLYPIRILTTTDEIENHYCRNVYHSTNNARFFSLIKLRGDVFNAICENEECRYINQRTPIYEIPPPQKDNKDNVEKEAKKRQSNLLFPLRPKEKQLTLQEKKKIYEEAVRCSGCLRTRKIELDFPGYRSKEKEVEEVLETLYRYAAPSLSCIVICGVSGKWDPELVDFVKVCAKQRNITIYCIDRSKQPAFKLQLGSESSRKGRFIHIEKDMSNFGEW